MRSALIAVGLILAAFGLLFIGQGLGYVRWPASSFMIDQSIWVTRGAIVAVAGLVLILIARRIRR
jgi:drug/metabolite transporter superfamily protein YnfA